MPGHGLQLSHPQANLEQDTQSEVSDYFTQRHSHALDPVGKWKPSNAIPDYALLSEAMPRHEHLSKVFHDLVHLDLDRFIRIYPFQAILAVISSPAQTHTGTPLDWHAGEQPPAIWRYPIELYFSTELQCSIILYTYPLFFFPLLASSLLHDGTTQLAFLPLGGYLLFLLHFWLVRRSCFASMHDMVWCGNSFLLFKFGDGPGRLAGGCIGQCYPSCFSVQVSIG